jgi:hypothetical protein
MSKEKVPIPQARGGNVEKIAVRTVGAPLSPDVRGSREKAASWIGWLSA